MDLIEISYMVKDCEKRIAKLNDWEYKFISDMAHKSSYSEKQLAIIEKIWERVTA
jgi:hypothetical protein